DPLVRERSAIAGIRPKGAALALLERETAPVHGMAAGTRRALIARQREQSMSLQNPPRAVLVLFIAAVALADLVGCATPAPAPQEMHSAAGVPASEGTVKATAGANGNTQLAVQVRHLAPPGKVAADATVYVVWIRPLDAALQNVGALI